MVSGKKERLGDRGRLFGFVQLTQERNFKRFSNLSENQMRFNYLPNAPRQVSENIRATVTKVHDGDTMTLKWTGRDFEFPIRLINLAAPELDEKGGLESMLWMKNRVEGKDVDIIIDPRNRVGKFGRVLGKVVQNGIDVGEEGLQHGTGIIFEQFQAGIIPNINKELEDASEF